MSSSGTTLSRGRDGFAEKVVRIFPGNQSSKKTELSEMIALPVIKPMNFEVRRVTEEYTPTQDQAYNADIISGVRALRIPRFVGDQWTVYNLPRVRRVL
jgi:hypothetical protein